MDQLTPVILFGAAAIAGHTWGDELLERFRLREGAERCLELAAEKLRRFFGRD
jgi:hypothetical protein